MSRGVMQSDLFDVAACVEENRRIKEQQHEQENINARKNITVPYFPTPKNDNELLMNYQHDYLQNNDKSSWGKLIALASEISYRLCLRWLRINKVSMDNIEVEERASQAMYYVLRRYQTRIGYAVTTNYIVALNFGVRHVMEHKTKLTKKTDYLDDVYPYAKQERNGELDESIQKFEESIVNRW